MTSTRMSMSLLRYGVKVRPDVGENTETVWLIDWKNPLNNDFAIAEEVTVEGEHTKRPDVVLYVNGIALGCAGAEALDRIGERGHPPESGQPEEDIYPALLHDHTVDHGGQRYRGAALRSHRDSREVLPDLERGERDREPAGSRSVAALRETAFSGDDPRFCGVRCWSQEDLPPQPVLRCACGAGAGAPARGRHHLAHPGQRQKPDHGLARQVDSRERPGCSCPDHHRSHRTGRADRKGLQGRQRRHLPHEKWARPHQQTQRHHTLAVLLAHPQVCWQGRGRDYRVSLRKSNAVLPPDFKAKGDLYVFVDECHRTQSGELHDAMKEILPNAMFIGFTGTPLLKSRQAKKHRDLWYVHPHLQVRRGGQG